ncbi:hypothetical protein BJV82DRAFT_583966 [Fennellomyces sp. T-0311]|nr:hypothetical protein BJV82DRAFT_583966 [Fennellomyces sp. T-0311]
MRNENPCQVCRSRRKKCIWRKGQLQCDRCSKFNVVECIPIDGSPDSSDNGEPIAQDGDKELQEWCTDIFQMETELQQMEGLLDALSNGRKLLSYSGQEVGEPEWQLSVVNGHVRLESTIQSIDELLLYTQASLRYLSPFELFFEKELVHFENTSISVPLASVKIIQRHITKPRKKFVLDYERFTDYGKEADRLVTAYFKHYNGIAGLLHEPTFLKYYHALDDVLDSALVLAVCVDATHAVRQQLNYSSRERRHLADYFYVKCKDLLFDLYDDPERRLEAIMCTSFVQTYLTEMVLDCAEARRLASVALLICADLDAQSATLGLVDRTIYARHRIYLEIYNRTYDMLLEEKLDFSVSPVKVRFTALDDEPETLRRYIEMTNYVFDFYSIPYIAKLLKEVNRLAYKKRCNLTLHTILLFEPVTREWWGSLPDEFRICDDPFAPNAYEYVALNATRMNLFPFASLHLSTSSIAASILQPRQSATPNSATTDLLHLVQEKAAALAINSVKVVMHLLKANLDTDLTLPSLSFEMLANLLYTLERLAACPNIRFPFELRIMAQDCYNKVKRMLPSDHHIPPSLTHLDAYFESLDASVLSFYDNYPLPGSALHYDIFFTSMKRLDQQLHPL